MVVLFHQLASPNLGSIKYKHHHSLQLFLASRELNIVIVGIVKTLKKTNIPLVQEALKFFFGP